MSNQVLKLLQGDDPTAPTATLDLCASGIFLELEGFAPAPGGLQVVWSGESGRVDGQERNDSRRDNARFSLTYMLKGSSAGHVAWLQSQINKFCREAGLYEEKAEGAPVWIEYRRGSTLSGIPAPDWGQFSHYMRVLSLEPKWPRTLHSPRIWSHVVAGVVADVVAAPLERGAEQTAGVASGDVSDTAYGTRLGDNDAKITWTLASQMAAQYTCGGWITPPWAHDSQAADVKIMSYTVDGDNFVIVWWDYDNYKFKVTGELANVAFSGSGAARTFAANTSYHLALVQGATTLVLYVNGAADVTITVAAGLGAAGSFVLGAVSANEGGTTGMAYDAWRIWDSALTATQVDAIYDDEAPIKALATAPVCRVPYWLTAAGTGALTNADDGTYTNWGILAGIPGDDEAEIEWRITPPTSGPALGYWLARKALSAKLSNPTSAFYVELQGTADAASSNGQYETSTLAAAGSNDESGALAEMPAQRGRVEYVARLQALAALTATAFYQFAAGYRIDGKAKDLAVDAAGLRLRDLGDLWINWPDATPAALTAGVNLAYDGTGNIAYIDLVQLLPYPLCRAVAVSATLSLSAGDVLIIKAGQAWIESSAGALKYSFTFRGDRVGAEPGKYNYVWLIQAAEGAVWDITLAATIAPIVTPRWSLA